MGDYADFDGGQLLMFVIISSDNHRENLYKKLIMLTKKNYMDSSQFCTHSTAKKESNL